MRVISASRRTDIPAFYSQWLLNRMKAGYCHWINPYAGQVYRVSLKPEDCLAIVFVTRNPAPLVPHIHVMQNDGYRFYFHITLTGYPGQIESNNPQYAEVVHAIRQIADMLSPEFVIWRYDPILLTSLTPTEYHAEQFARIASDLQGSTRQCYYSFMSMYRKAERNIVAAGAVVRDALTPVASEVRRDLALRLRDIAAARGMSMHECCGRGIGKQWSNRQAALI